MALSGTLKTKDYKGRYLELTWCAIPNGSNLYTINWTLKGAGVAEAEYYESGPFEVNFSGSINTQQKTLIPATSPRLKLYNGTVVASGSHVFYAKGNGYEDIYISLKANIGNAVSIDKYNVYYIDDKDNLTYHVRLDTVDTVPAMLSAPNFNDEENPEVKYYNPYGDGVDDLLLGISFDHNADNIPYRSVSKIGSSYTFNLTDEERDTIRNACTTANSMPVFFYLRAVIGSSNIHSYLQKTVTIINANPTFTTTIIDEREDTTELTGNDAVMISGANSMRATIKATPLKGATIKSYSIANNGKTINNNTTVFNDTTDNIFICTVIDSRGNRTQKEIAVPMVDYFPVNCSFEPKILLSTTDTPEAEIRFEITGLFYNGSFGAANNTLRLEVAAIADGGGATSEVIDVPASAFINNDTFNISHTLTGLDYREVWTAHVIISDSLTRYTAISAKLKAVPVYDWSNEDFNFNVPVAYTGKSLFILPGDEFTFNNNEITVGGMVANGSKDLYFTIPFNKLIFAESVSVSGSVMCRGVGGYANSGSALTVTEGATATITAAGVSVKIPFSAAIVSNANNTPIAVTAYGLTFKFN